MNSATVAPAPQVGLKCLPAEDGGASADWASRPMTPVDVEIVLQLRKLEVAVSHTETLMMRSVLEIYWTDPRLNGYAVERGVPPDIWRPQLSACVGLKMPDGAEAYRQLPTFYSGSSGGGKLQESDGRLKMDVKMTFGDDGWNLGEELNRLAAFPFDGARIDCSVVFGGSREETTEHIHLSLQRPNLPTRVDKCGHVQHIDWNCPRRSGDYAVSAISLGKAYTQRPYGRRNALVFSIHLERSPYFYLWKGIVPLFSVALFAFVTFALEPDQLADRLGILAALFLTTYAIQYVTIERLPRLPFATVFDNVAQSIVVSLGLIVVGQCSAYRYGRPPSGSASAAGLAFDVIAAERVDLATIIAVLVYLLLYSVGFNSAYRVWRAKRRSGAQRSWAEGPEQRNRWPVTEGYRLRLNDAFAAKHGKNFLGAGDEVRMAASQF